MKHSLNMRNKRFILLVATVAMALCITTIPSVSARKKEKVVEATTQAVTIEQTTPKGEKKPIKVTTEFGLGVGGRYNWFKVQPVSQNFTPNMSMMLSYGAALQFRLNIGKSFGIQPEISYAYSTIRITDNYNNFSTKAKSNIVQIPMLLSFRIAMFRLNFGPVFTLMDSTSYQLADKDETIKQMTLGKIYPSVTYAAGISVKVSRRMIIDARYADMFRPIPIKSENEYIWSLDPAKQPEAQRFKTTCRSVQLRVGVVF